MTTESSYNFKRGQLVRFLNGPVMRVVRGTDEDGDVLCMWLTVEQFMQCSFIPADFLIHASVPTADNHKDRIGTPIPAQAHSRPNLIRRCSSLIRNLLAPTGGNVR